MPMKGVYICMIQTVVTVFYNEIGTRLDANNKSDAGESEDIDLDYQHLPILKEDFASLSVFGKSKLRTCLVIKPGNKKS